VRIAISVVGLLLSAAATVGPQHPTAQSATQPTGPGNPTANGRSDGANVNLPDTSCLFDVERGDLPRCLRENPSGELFVAPRFLKELNFDSRGLATVHSPTQGWMYVTREGKVVITGVAVMDNWADSFHNGLVRFVRNGKYGFANRKGRVVIPSVYDGAMTSTRGLPRCANVV
jgi:WG containing repeat